MSDTESSAPNRRIEQLRPVVTSPGVKVYRAGSIARRLVTEGTRIDEEIVHLRVEDRGASEPGASGNAAL